MPSEKQASPTDIITEIPRHSPAEPVIAHVVVAPSPVEMEASVSHRKLSLARLLIVHIGAALTLFLATTDATIVSTSLPTIASDLKASPIQYSWVGVAYMLTQTAFQPLHGRVSDLIGRKNALYASILIFALGSALCGAAKSIQWLICARALAGIGGGGIVGAVWVITAEVVEVHQRATWSQALSVTWTCSAIAGPLIGGLFSGSHRSSVTWRWGFYINLPVCVVASLILALSLRGVEFKRSPTTISRLLKTFDFVGLFLFMSGTSCIIVGFSFATELGWTMPSTPSLIGTGMVVLVGGVSYEKYTTRERLFPITMFHDITLIAILSITFLHNFAFTAGTFYLALFFQAAQGYTPLQSGLRILPYSLGAALASMPAAWFIGYWQRRSHDTSGQKRLIAAGLFLSALGFGLLNLVNEHANLAAQICYPLIAGVGIGMLFHAPYQVFIRALKPQELATGTSAFFLTRFTGATVGLAVAGTIFSSRALKNLPGSLMFSNSPKSINYQAIKGLSMEEREKVVRVIALSVKLVWTVCAPCLGLALVLSFLLRVMPIPVELEDTAPGNGSAISLSTLPPAVVNPDEKT
ncbi:amino acid permease ScVBA-like protein [Agrocybe pediades]|nr:amino acid permease ScVBA-like protein [Agrocybe pediades]